MNIVHLLGVVISDPTLEETRTGRKVCRFKLSTSNGKNRPPTQHYIVILGRDQDDAHPNNVYTLLKRGGKAQISGRISDNRWKNRDGELRNRTEIIANNVEFVTWNTPQVSSNYEDSNAIS